MGALWTLNDARDRLETLVEAADRGEPQRVSLADDHEVVVVAKRDYDLMAQRPKTFVEHLMSFPKLPEGYDDIFDDRHLYPSTPREFDFEE